MANVTILDTVKVGWITINMGDYYPDRTPVPQFNIRKTIISDVDLEDKDMTSCVKMLLSEDRRFYFNITPNSDYIYSYAVDTVNGVAPTSIDDLRDKILALF